MTITARGHRGLRRAAIWGSALAGLLALAIALPAAAQVTLGGVLPAPLPLFPPDNWWNVDVSSAPVDPNSANFINFIGATQGLHPDFGGDVDPADPLAGIYGFPYIVVPGTQPLEPVKFVEFGNQSDDGVPGRPAGYPIPLAARTQPKWIEAGAPGGGDGNDDHMLIVDRDHRTLFELYHAHWTGVRWEAGSGAVFPLDSDARRPDTWTSADAAGLAILPGLVRYDEAFGSGPIRHAFRCTVLPSNGYVYPASHDAGSTSGALPMGARLRLKPGKNISGYTPEVQRIFQAMKTYGLIVADNGTDMYVQGSYDTRWNNDVLNPAFSSLKASDFEVVQLGWKPPVAATAGPLDFYTVAPCRLLDTRDASGPYGGPGVPPGTQRVIVAAGRCGIPAGAQAIAANVTVVGAAAAGDLRFFPGNALAPNTSTINFALGATRANNAILMLASSGSGTTAVQNDAHAAVHFLLDVTGYFR
jgi:hypothetical protein